MRFFKSKSAYCFSRKITSFKWFVIVESRFGPWPRATSEISAAKTVKSRPVFGSMPAASDASESKSASETSALRRSFSMMFFAADKNSSLSIQVDATQNYLDGQRRSVRHLLGCSGAWRQKQSYIKSAHGLPRAFFW